MDKNKLTKVIAVIIAAIAIVLIIVSVILPKTVKDKESNTYKQCAEPERVESNKKTNYEHTGINYYIDKENNRINNSEVLSTKHDSQGDETKKDKLSLENMTIQSKNCDENAAEMKANLINNSSEDLTNFMLVFDMKDKDGNLTHKFSMDIKELKQGEKIEISFKTVGRIIDVYDYEFTYTVPGEMEG